MICAPDASLEGFMVAAAVRAASPEVTVLTANTGRREQSVCFFAGGRAGVLHQNVGRVVQALDERPRGRGAELTLRLAAPIRYLCCATVSVPMEMRAAAFCDICRKAQNFVVAKSPRESPGRHHGPF